MEVIELEASTNEELAEQETDEVYARVTLQSEDDVRNHLISLVFFGRFCYGFYCGSCC
ncbi:hypothetical protein MKW94_006674 [Papaver nudicaule]|uniref:Uncharacterized protein n=1 Tax=Papaver nudicaule TaxID=74823 RepID=A0AA42B188_PAPNU|nr:hypothetical protein [Papaver nudicaule]